MSSDVTGPERLPALAIGADASEELARLIGAKLTMGYEQPIPVGRWSAQFGEL